jgi:hypothetical protein
MRSWKVLATAAIAVFLASACENGAFEEAGEDLDEATEDLDDEN